jgi:hypothetical protein
MKNSRQKIFIKIRLGDQNITRHNKTMGYNGRSNLAKQQTFNLHVASLSALWIKPNFFTLALSA